MPKFERSVKIPGKTADELYDKVAGDIDRFLSKGPIGNYEIERDPQQKKVMAKSSMFSATLTCEPETIHLHVNLSLLASPFKGKLDEGINKWLAKAFNVTL